MAILDLGTKSLSVGGGSEQFDPLIYDDKNAYIIYADMTVANIANVFSYVRIKPLITPNNEPSFYLTPYIDLEIMNGLQGFYLPTSSLFNGNGICVFEAERLSLSLGYGDTTSVSLNLFYDNVVTAKTWRN